MLSIGLEHEDWNVQQCDAGHHHRRSLVAVPQCHCNAQWLVLMNVPFVWLIKLSGRTVDNVNESLDRVVFDVFEKRRVNQRNVNLELISHFSRISFRAVDVHWKFLSAEEAVVEDMFFK